jgi:Holliday junction DNA helicase RuvA
MKLGYVEGKLIPIDQKRLCVLTTAGIGLEVYFDLTHNNLVATPQNHVGLFISQIVREDTEDYFAFLTLNEKILFEHLIQVKGIGPKTAFLILNNLGVDRLLRAISIDDKKTLRSVSGVGEKAASQILLDLKDKIHKIDFSIPSGSFVKSNSHESVENYSESGDIQDFLLACESLGFAREEALKKLYALPSEIRQKSSKEMLKELLGSLNA